MKLDAASPGLPGPAFVAGLLVTATHVPLGMQVLERGIVFIDLAVAQIAGVGVILADYLGWHPSGAAVQIAALSAALCGAMVLTWTERRWPEVQEAIIGVVYVLASSAAILLLAKNPRGGENLKELLIGQILWVNPAHLPLEALIYAAILAVWFGLRERLGRIGFYVLFSCPVTVSVPLVGLFLGFLPRGRPPPSLLLTKEPPLSQGLLHRCARLCGRPARVAVARSSLRCDDRVR